MTINYTSKASPEEMIEYGQLVWMLRKDLGMSQEALARKVGCTNMIISRIEAGKITPARPEIKNTFEKALRGDPTMGTLYIYRGLQGSGKSTHARKWVNEDPTKRARVNRDDLRQMMHSGVFIKGHTEPQVIEAQHAAISILLKQGIDVACDDTNLASYTVKGLLKIAQRWGCQVEFREFTDVSLKTCIERDAQRPAPQFIGPEIITRTYEQYIKGRALPLPIPTIKDREEDFVPVPYTGTLGKPQAVIFDMDGTVALLNGRGPYDEDRVGDDLPNQVILDAMFGHAAMGQTILITSGRTDECYEETMTWLRVKGVGPEILKREHLFMRKSGDSRKDAIVKHEIFWRDIAPHFDVRLTYDDRNQVVQLWRDMGLVCCQVAPGDF